MIYLGTLTHEYEHHLNVYEIERYDGELNICDYNGNILICDPMCNMLEIINTMYMNRIAYFEIKQGNLFLYKDSYELSYIEDDYEEIAKIYERLIRLGIVVGTCKFIRHEGKVMMTDITKICVCRNNVEAKNTYLRTNCIQKSIPRGMNVEKLRKLIFEEKCGENDERPEIELGNKKRQRIV